MNCIYCGKPLSGDSRFCSACGNPVPVQNNTQNYQQVQQQYSQQVPQKPAKRRKGPLLGLLIAFVIIVPMFILGWYVVEKIRGAVSGFMDDLTFGEVEYEGERITAQKGEEIVFEGEDSEPVVTFFVAGKEA